ncbi:MAG TPA: DUF4396 domain-containing protein [Candidatus Aquilonibacter sp.]|nr:DUF4396 domain-containing protein [Candidatus Aquilonibacter sp.]
MAPLWLSVLALVWLAISILCALALIVVEWRDPRKMAIMNVVWPVTALYMGPFAVAAFYAMSTPARAAKPKAKPFWQSTFVAVTHCGGGCTLGDIIAESAIFMTGFTFAGTLFVSYLVGDYVMAYVLGIVFQYFSIAPMRGISGPPAVWAAIKADTLSLTAFEVGLFAWMGLSHAVFFHPDVKPDQPVYWFMMQIGMCIGFATAFPMNWWLLKAGIKEKM